MRKALNQIRSQQRASSSDRGTGDALNYFMPGLFGRVPSWVDGVAKPHLPTSPLFHFPGEPPIGQPHSPSESHWPVDGQATPWPNTNGNWGSIEWMWFAPLTAMTPMPGRRPPALRSCAPVTETGFWGLTDRTIECRDGQARRWHLPMYQSTIEPRATATEPETAPLHHRP